MKAHPQSWWKKKADKIFSLWVRNREKQCVLCGSRNSLQAGHYVSRSCNQLRYDERNVHTCCMRCNVFLNGNMVEYTAFMIQKYGSGIINELRHEKVKTKQWKAVELQELIKRYEN
jgi:hypothetical protein